MLASNEETSSSSSECGLIEALDLAVGTAKIEARRSWSSSEEDSASLRETVKVVDGLKCALVLAVRSGTYTRTIGGPTTTLSALPDPAAEEDVPPRDAIKDAASSSPAAAVVHRGGRSSAEIRDRPAAGARIEETEKRYTVAGRRVPKTPPGPTATGRTTPRPSWKRAKKLATDCARYVGRRVCFCSAFSRN